MQHNVYFEGRVQSLSLNTPEGERATVGVISAGKYTFFAEFEEHVFIISGNIKVKLPNENWKEVATNDKYVVPRAASFEVETDSDVAYLCLYK